MTVRQIGGELSTVVDVLRAAAETNPQVEAYVEMADPGSVGVAPAGADGRRRLTFAQWDAAADGVARLLAARGVSRGDVVCLLLPSSIDYAVCYQAAARLGALTTGVNLRLGPAEQASITARTRPAVTVVDTDLVDDVAVPPGAGRIVPRSALADAAGGPAPGLPALDAADPVAVVWTSGSTGVPKGAVFDHRNLAAVAAGTDVLSHPGDRRLSPLPFAHVGYMTRPWDEIAHGVTTVIAPQPWSAATAIALLVGERVTVGQGVPTQWALMLAHPDFAGADVSRLRIAGTGAARVPPELVRAMRERLGCPVVVRYTSTETSLGTGTRPGDPDDVVATTVGRPVAGVDLELVDDRGQVVATGDVGRVRLRSEAAMRGYIGNLGSGEIIDATATAEVRDAAGWITTGDLGWVGSDGNLRLVGRVAEMYIRGGYNVYPAEVEAVLGGHRGVGEVAVVGVDDPVLGEVGVAVVVPAPGIAVPELGELRALCASRLADYKAPDRLVVVDQLPLTAMAKVDKRGLAAWLAAPASIDGTGAALRTTAETQNAKVGS
ncbi:MAG TPA: class I adenylate-forming enzyme family protein [Acidimicrobiales bacterium]|nr:class I adenylate-forming enzyme family protein [Acidimicrobiales bacterium]